MERRDRQGSRLIAIPAPHFVTQEGAAHTYKRDRATSGECQLVDRREELRGGDIEPVSELYDDVERWVAAATLQAAL